TRRDSTSATARVSLARSRNALAREPMQPNDYKRDENKPPLLDAVLIPYRRSLLAIAAMKADMKERHRLHGAANPFMEWRQLPNAEARLANAGARHLTQPWARN